MTSETKDAPVVPLADPRADHAGRLDDVLAAVAKVFEGGRYVLGPEVQAFEEEMASRLDAAGTVGVASGTDALVLGLLALDVGEGDEVITVSHTAGPTVAAIRMTGATPVLVDIDPETYCLDPAQLDAAVSPRCKAILPVHLYGHPADLAAINAFARPRGLAVVEDCAQAQEGMVDNRQVGSIGDVGCFSFYPTKNLGAIGDGGMVSTSRVEILDKLRKLRTYGWSEPQYADLPRGRCSRLDEIQAAILRIKLADLDAQIERRRAIARRYREELSGTPLILPQERAGCRHAYHLYVVRSDRRDALAAHLTRRSISSGRHYPYPVHVQPGLTDAVRIGGPLTVTETISSEILTLPLYPSLTDDQQQRVITAVRSFFGA